MRCSAVMTQPVGTLGGVGVGVVVGANVGATVGALVGASVGVAVGASVGAAVVGGGGATESGRMSLEEAPSGSKHVASGCGAGSGAGSGVASEPQHWSYAVWLYPLAQGDGTVAVLGGASAQYAGLVVLATQLGSMTVYVCHE